MHPGLAYPSASAVARRGRVLALATLLAVLGALLAGQSSVARAGESGTVSLDNRIFEFSGSMAPGATVATQTGAEGISTCPPQSADPLDTQCVHVTVDVDVPDGFWDDHIGGLRVVFNFHAGDDYELGIIAGGGFGFYDVASASSTRPEQGLVANASGSYEIHGLPYILVDGAYWGTAELVALTLDEAKDVQSPGFQSYTASPAEGRAGTEFDNPAAPWTGSIPAFAPFDVGADALEPTIGVGPDGAAYVAAAGSALSGTDIQRSDDNGATWTTVTPTVGGQKTPTTFDPYTYVDHDSGRVFSIDLQALTQSTLFFSDDGGASWTPGGPQPTGIVTDHQTLTSGPPGDGQITLDPAFPEVVYYCFNRVAESVCERSLDGGITFLRTGSPVFAGVGANDSERGYGVCGGLHGHAATDLVGTLLLPKGHCGVPSLGVSTDSGTSWTTVEVSDITTYINQTSVAADSAGNFYYVFMDTTYLPYLVTSTDRGATWSDPVMIAPPGVRDTMWPTVEAGDEGRISVGFPCTRAEGILASSPTRAWDYCITTSLNALDATPTFASNIGNAPDDPIHRGECPSRCGNLYDFLDLTVAPASGGGAIWAVYVDSCTEAQECSTNPATIGFDGDSDNASAGLRGTAVRQTCGPSVWVEVGELTDSCPAAVAPVAAEPEPAPVPAPAPSNNPLPATGGGIALAALAAFATSTTLRRRTR